MSAYTSSDAARAEILEVASRIAAGKHAYRGYDHVDPKECVDAAADLIAEVDKHVKENSRHVKEMCGSVYDYQPDRSR